MERRHTVFTSSSSHEQRKDNSITNFNELSNRGDSTSIQNLGTSDTNEEPKATKKTKKYCGVSQSTSHTRFFKKDRHDGEYKIITRDEYDKIPESISGSSDSFHCVHRPDGKKYTEKGLLQRNLIKELDPIRTDNEWTVDCPPAYGWDMAEKLEFLVSDPIGVQQVDRLYSHLKDFAKTAKFGFRIDKLDSVCIVLDYLVEKQMKEPLLREGLILLLQNTNRPILLNAASGIIKHFEQLQFYIGFLGYLLIRMEEDELFDMVSKAVMWQLSASDSQRGQGTVRLHHTVSAAAPVLYQTASRMLCVTSSHRFPIFLEIALILACDSVDNCIILMKENIIENIFYRFNPYFPERKLPVYDINPADLQDFNVKLGDSSLNISTTLSLLLILLKTTNHYLEDNPTQQRSIPCPDKYGQRCFIWAYRYECRAREHRHQRNTMTVIVAALLKCFKDRLLEFGNLLMADVMSLSVLTELPPRLDWTRTVNINVFQMDVQFKKLLVYLSVKFLKVFPYNNFMVESRYWLLGLMYLLDPGLCYLRANWSPPLFAEIRKTALQALVCTLPLSSPHLTKEYGLIRRIMWYIEWYSEKSYEIPVLYWCVRLLQVAIYQRGTWSRKVSIGDLLDTHGIIILIHLCNTLLEQKLPPVEKSQAIIAICLRLLTSALEANRRLTCFVYRHIKWPASINTLARKMMDIILYSLEKHYIVSERWLISLLNFIWEAIVWRKDYRDLFILNNGIYKLLDIITMTKAPVQCIALALLCDVARSGDAVGQLVSWRANLGASNAHPTLVRRGSTIASLLASVFRDECHSIGVYLNEYGVIMDLEHPLMSIELRAEMYNPESHEGKSMVTPVCLPAGDLAGSRLSKAFALLHMLSEDLECKVTLADETYNLYKNIKLSVEDETVLVLCSHYMTIKLNEVWTENLIQSPGFLPDDEDILNEFLHFGKGWAKEIKRQQQNVVEKDRKTAYEEECSLYAFLGRVRLNIALDALQQVRCVARSSDRGRIIHTLLHDAIRAHHRRSVFETKQEKRVLKTYEPSLDDQSLTGQYMKVFSIQQEDKAAPRRGNLSS